MADLDVDPKFSILTSVKKLLGIQEEDESFDVELILDINSIFMILNQLGLGPEKGFFIEDKEDAWTDFLKDRNDLNAVKTYIYLKVRLMFDPPQMGYLVDSINKQCQELEWRINVQAENEEHGSIESPIEDLEIDTNTLKIVDNVLSVNTTNSVAAGNSQPITSAGVHTEVGNINTLLAKV